MACDCGQMGFWGICQGKAMGYLGHQEDFLYLMVSPLPDGVLQGSMLAPNLFSICLLLSALQIGLVILQTYPTLHNKNCIC